MAANDEENEFGGTWLINSGCSNYMSDEMKLFESLEATLAKFIRLGDGKSLQVEGVGKVTLWSHSGKITTLNNV